MATAAITVAIATAAPASLAPLSTVSTTPTVEPACELSIAETTEFDPLVLVVLVEPVLPTSLGVVDGSTIAVDVVVGTVVSPGKVMVDCVEDVEDGLVVDVVVARVVVPGNASGVTVGPVTPEATLQAVEEQEH